VHAGPLAFYYMYVTGGSNHPAPLYLEKESVRMRTTGVQYIPLVSRSKITMGIVISSDFLPYLKNGTNTIENKSKYSTISAPKFVLVIGGGAER